jgi:hypothetical protein
MCRMKTALISGTKKYARPQRVSLLEPNNAICDDRLRFWTSIYQKEPRKQKRGKLIRYIQTNQTQIINILI